MKLIQLRLENFRQHADSVIDFRDGMTAIVGANGSGKTTLLEAITFALYGEQRDKKDTVRFYWAPPRKKFRVELIFDFDGKRYSVERGEDDAALVHVASEKTHVLATGLKAVTAACERLTSLNYEQFTNSFCAEQKGLAFLEFKSKTARQDEIARMLGYDRLKQAAALGKTRAKEYRDQISGMERVLGNESELKAASDSAKAQVQGAVVAVNAAETRQTEIAKALPAALEARKAGEQFLALLHESRAIAAKAEGLKTAVKLSQEALEAALVDAKELTLLRPLEAQFLESEQALKALDAQREIHLARAEKVKRLEELKVELAEIELRLKNLGSPDLAALESKLAAQAAATELGQKALKSAEDSWREDQHSAKRLLDVCNERLEEANRQLQRAKDLVARGICPECGQSTADSGSKAIAAREKEVAERKSEHDKLLKNAETALAKPKAVSEAETQQKSLTEELDKARTFLADAKAVAARRSDESGRKTNIEKAVERLTQELAATPSTYDAKAHEQARARRDVLHADHVRFLKIENAESRVKECEAKHEAARTELEAAKAGYRALEDQRKVLGIETEAAAQTAVEAHTRLQGELAGAERDLANAQKLHELHTKALADAESRLENLRKQEEAIRQTRKALELHDITSKELLALRERLNKTIRPDLEARASDNLSLLTNGRYAVLKLDEDFQSTVVEDDVDKPVISGGEEDVVALSLRLALSELIQERQGRPMSLLILDEVFGSLDSSRRQSVLDRLASIKGRFNQILVISHIEEINLVADQCLYVTRDAETRAARVTDAAPEFALVSPF